MAKKKSKKASKKSKRASAARKNYGKKNSGLRRYNSSPKFKAKRSKAAKKAAKTRAKNRHKHGAKSKSKSKKKSKSKSKKKSKSKSKSKSKAKRKKRFALAAMNWGKIGKAARQKQIEESMAAAGRRGSYQSPSTPFPWARPSIYA